MNKLSNYTDDSGRSILLLVNDFAIIVYIWNMRWNTQALGIVLREQESIIPYNLQGTELKKCDIAVKSPKSGQQMIS